MNMILIKIACIKICIKKLRSQVIKGSDVYLSIIKNTEIHVV